VKFFRQRKDLWNVFVRPESCWGSLWCYPWFPSWPGRGYHSPLFTQSTPLASQCQPSGLSLSHQPPAMPLNSSAVACWLLLAYKIHGTQECTTSNYIHINCQHYYYKGSAVDFTIYHKDFCIYINRHKGDLNSKDILTCRWSMAVQILQRH